MSELELGTKYREVGIHWPSSDRSAEVVVWLPGLIPAKAVGQRFIVINVIAIVYSYIQSQY